jgi:hypothetical protein
MAGVAPKAGEAGAAGRLAIACDCHQHSTTSDEITGDIFLVRRGVRVVCCGAHLSARGGETRTERKGAWTHLSARDDDVRTRVFMSIDR